MCVKPGRAEPAAMASGSSDAREAAELPPCMENSGAIACPTHAYCDGRHCSATAAPRATGIMQLR